MSGIALSHHERGNELAVSIQPDERPNVPDAQQVIPTCGVLGFLADQAPNFIAFDVLAF